MSSPSISDLVSKQKFAGLITEKDLIRKDLEPKWLSATTPQVEKINNTQSRRRIVNPYHWLSCSNNDDDNRNDQKLLVEKNKITNQSKNKKSSKDPKVYQFHQTQELALSMLVWSICSDLKRRKHNEAKAERTVAYLMKRAENKRRLQEDLGYANDQNNNSILHKRNTRYDDDYRPSSEHDNFGIVGDGHQQQYNNTSPFNLSNRNNKNDLIELSDDEVATLACDERIEPFTSYDSDKADQDSIQLDDDNSEKDQSITKKKVNSSFPLLDDDEIDFIMEKGIVKKNHREQKREVEPIRFEVINKPYSLKYDEKEHHQPPVWQDTTLEEDLDEIERAIEEKFPSVRCKNLPQPPLVMKEVEDL